MAADNGRQADHTPYHSTKRNAGSGQLVGIVQSTKESGKITVKATSPGLQSSQIIINTTSNKPKTTEINEIIGYKISKYIKVKLGNKPILPNNIEVLYKNGKTGTKNIIWKNYNSNLVNKEGTFIIQGNIEGTELNVSVLVEMLDNVVAILNYSTAIKKDAKIVNLPNTRPAVLSNGKITNSEFPVIWDMVGVDLDKIGTHIINGKSFIFGKEIPVTASIRVSEGEIETGSNVSSSAIEINETNGNNKLENLKDGKTNFEDNKYWVSNSNDKNSSVQFTYATVNELRRISLYYIADDSAFKLPKNVKIKWSSTSKNNLTELDVKASKPIEVSKSNGKTIYRVDYDFNPISALSVKIEFISDDSQNSRVALSEVELKLANHIFSLSNEDTLSEITVNGISLNKTELKKREYKTSDIKVDVKVKTDKNTAFTILPPNKNIIKILTESEDNSKKGEYIIILREGKDNVQNKKE